MPRETFVERNGEWVPKHLAAPLHAPDAAPAIIRDGMDATWHPANGKRYDSKSAFRKATKAAGCVEVGDQKDFGGRKFKPRMSNEKRALDIKRAIQELSSR